MITTNIFKKISIFYLLISLFTLPITSAHTIIINSDPELLPYALNQDLHLEPYHKTYYDRITHEIDALESCLGKNKLISLSKNPQANSIAPQLLNLISTKAQKIAAKMGLDMSSIEICIQPTAQEIKSAFNAHAQTTLQASATKEVKTETLVEQTICDNKVISSKVIDVKTTETITHDVTAHQRLALNAESIKLILWHEGQPGYDQIEGLLDGIIAHELAHLFHKHMECSIACECQADATGAKSLSTDQYGNLINAVDTLYFAGNLFSALKTNQQLLQLSSEALLTATNAITSSLARQTKYFGYLSQCSSHTQFSSKMQQAFGKAVQRIANHRALGNNTITMSLVYDEILDCCKTPLDSYDGISEIECKKSDYQMALYSQLTHPDPLTRRTQLGLALR